MHPYRSRTVHKVYWRQSPLGAWCRGHDQCRRQAPIDMAWRHAAAATSVACDQSGELGTAPHIVHTVHREVPQQKRNVRELEVKF